MDRIWRDARSIGDLGGAMAGWLEGRVDSRPGYNHGRPCRPDAETDHLIPLLARLNRRGYVTTGSQPGLTTFGYNPDWDQRAAVEGWIASGDPLLPRILRTARAAGLIVSAYGAGRAMGPRRGFVVTRRGGEPHTDFGGRPCGLRTAPELSGVGRGARRELIRNGIRLAVTDPMWGRDTVLWSALDQAMNFAHNTSTTDQGMRTA